MPGKWKWQKRPQELKERSYSPYIMEIGSAGPEMKLAFLLHKERSNSTVKKRNLRGSSKPDLGTWEMNGVVRLGMGWDWACLLSHESFLRKHSNFLYNFFIDKITSQKPRLRAKGRKSTATCMPGGQSKKFTYSLYEISSEGKESIKTSLPFGLVLPSMPREIERRNIEIPGSGRLETH